MRRGMSRAPSCLSTVRSAREIFRVEQFRGFTGEPRMKPPARNAETLSPLAEEMLRVAVDATPLLGRPTGVGAFCSGLLEGLAGRHDLSVAAFAVSWRRRHQIENQVPPGVTVAQRAMPARPLHHAWRWSNHPSIERFIGHADVVHGTNYVVAPTRRAARIVTVHDLTPVRFPELCDEASLSYPALVRRAVRGGAWVHTHSAYVADEVVEVFGADPDRVRRVHPGVPPMPPGDSGVARRFLPAGTSRYVLAIGTIEPRKDLPTLVRAFDELAGERDDLALVLAGPPGWGADKLDGATAVARHRSRIVLTGWVDVNTLSGLLHAATVLAYPSIYEGFGFPPLQAMTTGVPVVATRAGSLPEVLGNAAALVPVGDPVSLAESLARVLDSDDVRADMVARGHEHVARFSWSRCAEELDQMYRAAAGR
ncbi:MAG: glycosyltransferase family 4 protein [Acidimicrobiales bacterium]